MFKLSTAKLSLLLLAVVLLPSGMLRADTGDSTDIVVGPDPQPTGNTLWLELELGIAAAFAVA